MGLHQLRDPHLPAAQVAVQRRPAAALGRADHQASRARRRSRPRVELRYGRLAPRERLVESGQVADHDRDHRQPAAGVITCTVRASGGAEPGGAVLVIVAALKNRSSPNPTARPARCEPRPTAGTRIRPSSLRPRARGSAAPRAGRTCRASCRRPVRAGGARARAREASACAEDRAHDARVALYRRGSRKVRKTSVSISTTIAPPSTPTRRGSGCIIPLESRRGGPHQLMRGSIASRSPRVVDLQRRVIERRSAVQQRLELAPGRMAVPLGTHQHVRGEGGEAAGYFPHVQVVHLDDSGLARSARPIACGSTPGGAASRNTRAEARTSENPALLISAAISSEAIASARWNPLSRITLAASAVAMKRRGRSSRA